jgi:hypothetical protein
MGIELDLYDHHSWSAAGGLMASYALFRLLKLQLSEQTQIMAGIRYQPVRITGLKDYYPQHN